MLSKKETIKQQELNFTKKKKKEKSYVFAHIEKYVKKINSKILIMGSGIRQIYFLHFSLIILHFIVRRKIWLLKVNPPLHEASGKQWRKMLKIVKINVSLDPLENVTDINQLEKQDMGTRIASSQSKAARRAAHLVENPLPFFL